MIPSQKSIAEIVKLRRQKAGDKDLFGMSLLEGDEEEVKEGTGLKIVTPNKLLTRLPILLSQIKAGNNSYKLKNKIRQILYLLCQHSKITKKVYNNLMKSLYAKTFCFNFDLPKDVDENLKCEIEFIIKNNDSLAEIIIKSKIEQLLLKYKHGNNINELGEQQNK